METYAEVQKKKENNAQLMGKKRQEKALREFKQVLDDLMFLLRNASGMQTVYMYWVNRSRKQFVMETQSTSCKEVMFQDRVDFGQHFLESYRDLTEPLTIQVGKEIEAGALSHYYNDVPVRYITILPFLNNNETVAITVLESENPVMANEKSEVIYSYINALRNVLNTYLEISDLYERQDEWAEYEEQLNVLNTRSHRAEIISRMLNAMQNLLHEGGVSFIGQNMDQWTNLLNADHAQFAPPVGMPMEERTLAYEALQKGNPEFSIHFNNNPKRLSPREIHTEGATLAIPLVMHERRQGLVLVYDKNPLIFKESTKHKLINFVRMASFKIMANDPKLDISKSLVTNEYHALLPDVWERIIQAELQRKNNDRTNNHSWFGLITLADLPGIRTKLRLEELNQMQHDLVVAFNPNRFGVSGSIGFHADYVYSFFLQSSNPNAIKEWTSSLRDEFRSPFKLSNGKEIQSGIKIGYVTIKNDLEDAYQVVNKAKAALSQAMKKSEN